MKITDVRVLSVNRFLFVEIVTNEGLVGLGESGAWGFVEASRGAVETFKTYLIGQDPLRIEHHWQYMYRCWHFRGAAIMGAISAIDIALWDIAGKYFNTPVYNMLGGKCRNKARVYCHVGGETMEEMLQGLKVAKAQGFTAVGHLSPFLDEPRSKPYFETYAGKIGNAIDRVAEYRAVLGKEVDICLEIHRSLKPSEAIALAQGIETYHPYFFEDPVTPDNFDTMAWIAEHIKIPIATGERYHTPQEFAQIIHRKAVEYIRPDVCLCGGITGAKKIAAIAEANDVMVVPHNPLSPVSTAACIQIAACIPNFAILEFPGDDYSSAIDRTVATNGTKQFYRRDIVKKTIPYEDGFMIIPDDPGIGVELVEDADGKYPVTQRQIKTRLHVDGSVIDQ